MSRIRGACPHNCPDTCGWTVDVDSSGRATRIAGNPEHPYTQGWLCTKVNRYLELVYHPERLLHPLRRRGARGAGEWERISWDQALDEIAARWTRLIDEHGPEAILPYSYSGTLGLVQAEVCNQRLWTRMGASGLARTICSVAGTEAVRLTLGAGFGADPEGVVDSRLVLLWGTNPASTHPHFIPWLDEARRRGARVYLIDPHRSLTANRADVVLQPRPGSDAALALAMMHLLFKNGLPDDEWSRRHTTGLDELRERVEAYSPEWAAKRTGLDEGAIRQLAHDYATQRPALIRCSMGLQRHSNGGNTIRCLACLPALTGDYGRAGGGLLYSTGGYMPWPQEIVSPPELRAASPNPSPRVINMIRLGAALQEADPPVRALYIFNSNPASVAPNSGRVLRGLSREDLFTVVHEQFMTETARMADILLPATTQFEQWDLHRAYGHLYLQINQPAIAPRGESRSNWQVMQSLAHRMGYREEAFSQSAEEIIRQVLESARETTGGITWEQLLEKGWARLPYARPHVPFADGHFPTPSGRVELYSRQLEQIGLDPLPSWIPEAESAEGSPRAAEYPLQLVSAASHYFLNSSFSGLPTLRRLAGAPAVEMNPADAAARGIEEGDLVELFNDRGGFTVRARISSSVQPGALFTPTLWRAADSVDGRGANWTTSDEPADYAGGAVFHGNLVEARPARSEAAPVMARESPAAAAR